MRTMLPRADRSSAAPGILYVIMLIRLASVRSNLQAKGQRLAMV